MTEHTAEDQAKNRRGMLGPAWRFETARSLCEIGAPDLLEGYDPFVRKAWDFLCRETVRQVGGDEGAGDPAIKAAFALQRETTPIEALKILAIGDSPPVYMAQRLGLPLEVVEAWEALFYDVRAARDALTWVNNHVIQPELDRGDEELVAKLKLAYCGRFNGALAILDAESRIPLSAGEKLFARQVKLNLKFKQAALVSVDTDQTKIRFLTTYPKLQLEQERIRLAERKFSLRCLKVVQQHELAQIRLQQTAERQRQRTEAQHEKRRRKAEEQQQKEQQRELLRGFHETQRRAEQEAARVRAASSPLARLCWFRSTLADAQTVGEWDEPVRSFGDTWEPEDAEADAAQEMSEALLILGHSR